MRTNRFPFAVALAATIFIGACAKQADQAADAAIEAGKAPTAGQVAGQRNRADTFLAYEHQVHLRLPGAQVAPRVAAVRDACMAERFGACVVLGEEQGAGEFPQGHLKVRADPKAIGGLVDLPAEGAQIAQRSTTAEDLGDAIHDNSLRQRRLKLQHDKLSELAARPGGKLEDLMMLNERLASLEAELMNAEREAAIQQRRVETNLLTLHFESEVVSVASVIESDTRRAFRSLYGIWDTSFAGLVVIVGAVLPWVVFAVLVWLVVRAVKRRVRTAS
jgi:hypothetical protein